MVAYEEIKILREDLLRDGETMDKNKSHFLSLENTEEIRRLEQQELAFWRGSASKTLAGWTRDGSAEEIAGWTMEAQRERDRGVFTQAAEHAHLARGRHQDSMYKVMALRTQVGFPSVPSDASLLTHGRCQPW